MNALKLNLHLPFNDSKKKIEFKTFELLCEVGRVRGNWERKSSISKQSTFVAWKALVSLMTLHYSVINVSVLFFCVCKNSAFACLPDASDMLVIYAVLYAIFTSQLLLSSFSLSISLSNSLTLMLISCCAFMLKQNITLMNMRFTIKGKLNLNVNLCWIKIPIL